MSRSRSRAPGRLRAALLAVATAMTVPAVTAGPVTADPVLTHAVAWGGGFDGELGDGGQSNRTAPVAVLGEYLHFGEVSGGSDHSLAIAADGTVWAWGDNSHHQLGRTGGGSPIPLPVTGPTGAVDVGGGWEFSTAVGADGRVWTWGKNESAELGRGGVGGPQAAPQRVPGLANVVDVEAGSRFVLALRGDGTVWGWGASPVGQLGLGYAVPWVGSPVQVPGLHAIVDIAAGNGHGLAVRADGTVFAWGYGQWGQLGDGMSGNRLSPTPVPGLGGVRSVAAGAFHSLALRPDGTVWSWGNNDGGQLGNDTFTSPIRTPVHMVASGVAEIAAGDFSSHLRLADGTVRSCGYNYDGQLGDGTTTRRGVPVPVHGLTRVRQIAAGSSHVLAVQEPVRPEPPLSFTVDVEPNHVTLPAGGSVTVAVTVAGSTAGRPVALSAGKGLPPGVTAAFDPPAIQPGQPAQLTLTAGPQTVPTDPRVVTVPVHGTAGTTTKSAALDLTISSPAG
ncbi:RCC1 domain-containing protein [Actinomadura craniellae]|nr:hypothetical protein [Actinomadura craniellae]